MDYIYGFPPTNETLKGLFIIYIKVELILMAKFMHRPMNYVNTPKYSYMLKGVRV